MTSSNIYDEIVEEYSQAKSNPYKQYVEEPTFWSCAGKDFSGKTVLDLACGSGHYSRQFRIHGAHQVCTYLCLAKKKSKSKLKFK